MTMTSCRSRPSRRATHPIASPADLRQRWRALMQELGFGERLLRIAFVGPDRRFIKVLTEVEIGPRPITSQVDALMAALATLIEGLGDGTTAALLLTRPGRGESSNADRSLAGHAHRVGGTLRRPTWNAIFRANDEALVADPPGPTRRPPARSDSGMPASRAPAPRRECRRPASAPAGRRSRRPNRVRYRPAPRRSPGCCA